MYIMRPLVLAALTLVISACSQTAIPGTKTAALRPQNFGTTASDNASGLAKHSSGVYVVGDTSGNLHGTNKGGTDAFIRKVDTDGKVIWGRQFGTAAGDAASDVAADATGNAYVLGRTSGNMARTLRGGNDFFLRKYTSSGSVAWTRQFGLDTADYPGGVAVSGNFVYVVGMGDTFGAFVYRFSTSSGRTWSKKQLSAYVLYQPKTDITVDGNGNIYIASTISVTCVDQHPYSACTNVRIDKYNTLGNLVWSKQLNYAQRDSGESITAYGSSVYVAIHTFDVPDDEHYVQLVKLNTSGTAQWIKFLGVADAYEEYLRGRSDTVSADSSGVYVASTAIINYVDHFDLSYDRQAYSAAKFATDGSPVWELGSLSSDRGDVPEERLYGFLNAVVARGGSDVYIAGNVNAGVSRSNDAFLKRLNASTGGTVWNR